MQFLNAFSNSCTDASQGIFIPSCLVSVEIIHGVNNILSRKPINILTFHCQYFFLYVMQSCCHRIFLFIFAYNRKWYDYIAVFYPPGKKILIFFFNCQYCHVTEYDIKKPAKSAHLQKHLLYSVNPLGYLTSHFLHSCDHASLG